MRPNFLLACRAAAAVLLLPGPCASATTLSFSGDFACSAPNLPEVPLLSGSFDFLVDDSVLSGSGFEIIDSITLNSLTLNPSPLGATVFTVGNSAAELLFIDGVLASLFIGGTINGVTAVLPAADDWVVAYGGTGSRPLAAASIASNSAGYSFYSESSGSFTLRGIPSEPVPEPSCLVLTILVLGLAGTPIVRAFKRRS